MATEGTQHYRERPEQAAWAGDCWKAAQVGWVKEAQGGGSKQKGQQYRKLTIRGGGRHGLVLGNSGRGIATGLSVCLSLHCVPGCHFV